jgi:dihydropteroate synthase
MQASPDYTDVVAEVMGFLQQRTECCVKAGLPREKILLDPGFGFGKTLAHNLQILKHLVEFQSLGHPLLVGMSRKRMIAEVLGQFPMQNVDNRLSGSLALASLATWSGASIIRVHDVKPTVDVVTMVQATLAAD